MVTFPPLMPSVRWFADFIQTRARKNSLQDSINFANRRLSSTREFGRYLLLDSKGDLLTLSLAVERGGRQLRYQDKLPELRLSEHGDWRRNHLKAMEACLGRKPFFPYIFPELEDIYLNKNFINLKDFNEAIFKFLLNFIVGNILDEDLARFFDNETLLNRGKEIASVVSPEISSVETVSTFGKESLLGFLALG